MILVSTFKCDFINILASLHCGRVLGTGYGNATLLHFVAFFHVASLLSTGVDNEKALELDNRIFFHISA